MAEARPVRVMQRSEQRLHRRVKRGHELTEVTTARLQQSINPRILDRATQDVVDGRAARLERRDEARATTALEPTEAAVRRRQLWPSAYLPPSCRSPPMERS